MTAPVRRLTCCICGEYAGRWEQHWNRDTGWGVCAPCVKAQRVHPRHPMTEEEIEDLYGKEGVNWGEVPS